MGSYKVKKMAGIGILSAVTVVLAFISNYIPGLAVNINLALIPIVVGACIYGPASGLFLGIVDGVLICFAPDTLTYFMTHNVIATIILCLLKTGLGGFMPSMSSERRTERSISWTRSTLRIHPVISTQMVMQSVLLQERSKSSFLRSSCVSG